MSPRGPAQTRASLHGPRLQGSGAGDENRVLRPPAPAPPATWPPGRTAGTTGTVPGALSHLHPALPAARAPSAEPALQTPRPHRARRPLCPRNAFSKLISHERLPDSGHTSLGHRQLSKATASRSALNRVSNRNAAPRKRGVSSGRSRRAPPGHRSGRSVPSPPSPGTAAAAAGQRRGRRHPEPVPAACAGARPADPQGLTA